MTNALAGKNFGQPVGGPAILPRSRSRAEVNVTTCDLLVKRWIAGVRKVIDGVVEIKIVVVHAVHEIPEVVDARHRKAALDNIRVFEEAVRGVVRPKGSAHRRDGNA